jgi:hypothetical protein
MYGQTGFGGGVESLDSSLFRFCPPIILWVCSFFFFNQFKNLFAFLLDLICATIQRCFLASELLFCAFPPSLPSLVTHYYYYFYYSSTWISFFYSRGGAESDSYACTRVSER